MYQPVGITAGASSFYAQAAPSLDPELFSGTRMKAEVRRELLGKALGFLRQRYMGPEFWLKAWLAGSGASFRWDAARGLKDLDILLGVEWVTFRLANSDFDSMGNKEIARVLNDDLRENLWPEMKGWKGQYEVTFYVNAASDIRDIKPYAAYDLIADGWTVPPSKDAPVVPKEYEVAVGVWHDRAKQVVSRYSHMLTQVQNAQNPAARATAEAGFRNIVGQAENLFDDIHQARRASFTEGQGYADWGNYLWQSGKQHGWLPALRAIKDFAVADRQARDVQTYGVELPDQDVLLRRAALAYRSAP